jgi:hypothetical protein
MSAKENRLARIIRSLLLNHRLDDSPIDDTEGMQCDIYRVLEAPIWFVDLTLTVPE